MRLVGKFGLIGDIHGEDAFLNIALDFFEKEAISQVLATGDVVDGPGDVGACIETLTQKGVAVVAGNHEQWFLRDMMRDLPMATPADALPADLMHTLAAWPLTRRFETPVGNLLLCHGLGENTMAMLRESDFGYALKVNADLQQLVAATDIQLVVHGHSHQSFVRHFDGLSVINGGTLLRGYSPCVTIVDFDQNRVRSFNIASSGEVSQRTSVKLVPDYRLL